VIWPLNDHQIDLLHVLKDLEFLKSQNFELIGFNFDSFQDNNNEKSNENTINSNIKMIKQELNKNFRFSSFVKKKSEYMRFLEYFASFLLESKKVTCAFRFQGSDEDLISNQLFENKVFNNSIQKCSDGIIPSLFNKKMAQNNAEDEKEYRMHIFLQNFDIVFIHMDLVYHFLFVRHKFFVGKNDASK